MVMRLLLPCILYRLIRNDTLDTLVVVAASGMVRGVWGDAKYNRAES
jgi:hypothetical protein